MGFNSGFKGLKVKWSCSVFIVLAVNAVGAWEVQIKQHPIMLEGGFE